MFTDQSCTMISGTSEDIKEGSFQHRVVYRATEQLDEHSSATEASPYGSHPDEQNSSLLKAFGISSCFLQFLKHTK